MQQSAEITQGPSEILKRSGSYCIGQHETNIWKHQTRNVLTFLLYNDKATLKNQNEKHIHEQKTCWSCQK